MRVIFHHEAHAEMIEQARYYESKSEGLGSDFLDAVEDDTSYFLTRRMPVRLNERMFANVSYRGSHLQSYTKYNRIEYPSPP